MYLNCLATESTEPQLNYRGIIEAVIGAEKESAISVFVNIELLLVCANIELFSMK